MDKKINFTETDGICIAEIISDDIVINTLQEALDIMADCSYQGAGSIIIHEKNIISVFFDLKTGLAGDILQKFSNYNIRLAIVGDFSKYQSKSLRDFIYECNKSGRINFVNSAAEAKEVLMKK